MKIYRIAFESPELEQLNKALEAQYPGLSLSVYENEYKVYISEIRLKPEMQNQGIGTAVIKRLQEYATKIGKPVVLHPQADPRKKQKLDDFYKNLGFVDNKGRKTDYRLTEPFARTMFWRPPKSENL